MKPIGKVKSEFETCRMAKARCNECMHFSGKRLPDTIKNMFTNEKGDCSGNAAIGFCGGFEGRTVIGELLLN
jgi:hypothetical protein